MKKCDFCGVVSSYVINYLQNGMYYDNTRDYVNACPECKESNDDYWEEIRSDIYMQITLGALADSIKDQLGKINTTPEQTAQIEALDMDARAISRLYVRGLISDSQKERARKKLLLNLERILIKNHAIKDG